MNLLKKFGLVFSTIAFCLTLSVIAADAQRRNRNWNGNQNGNWQQVQNNRWRQNRNGRITPQEYRQLQRKRVQIYRTRNRYYNNDGYISNQERRKLQKKYYKYQRKARRDRRDW
ncbi:MAG TPA: hypothetical protein VGC76_19660 [Pyrinomonadaceae bacterium]|jgi:hypothetical protein